MYDLDSLQKTLNTNVSNSVDSTVHDLLGKLLIWVILPTVIITVLFIVFYIMHMLRRRKIENAILDIRDTLHRMEQAQTLPIPAVPAATPLTSMPPETHTLTDQPVQEINQYSRTDSR